jgi:hypothetical protein
MNYPPPDLPADVELYELAGGLPVSKGRSPGCPWFVALWGGGAPMRFGKDQDRYWCPPESIIPPKRVSEQEFRQLITIRQAGY